jgi:drug/metabolite transporter (DMT)-like permease
MSELLSLASALSYGVADFLGGMATKQRHVLRVVAVSHVVGLVVVLAVSVVAGGAPNAADLWWGVMTGVAGLMGVGFLYWSLAVGTMGVVAPVTAAVGAIIPVVVGLLWGERPAPLAVAGVGVAGLAIVLVSTGDSTGWMERPATTGRALVGAGAAGVGFGLIFVFMSRMSSQAGMWPLVSARVTSLSLLIVLLLVLRPAPTPGGVRLSAAAGVLDMSGNMFVLAALDGGMLVIVSVLSALYPAATVLLARFFLRERLRFVQLIGIVLAIGSIAMISMS